MRQLYYGKKFVTSAIGIQLLSLQIWCWICCIWHHFVHLLTSTEIRFISVFFSWASPGLSQAMFPFWLWTPTSSCRTLQPWIQTGGRHHGFYYQKFLSNLRVTMRWMRGSVKLQNFHPWRKRSQTKLWATCLKLALGFRALRPTFRGLFQPPAVLQLESSPYTLQELSRLFARGSPARPLASLTPDIGTS